MLLRRCEKTFSFVKIRAAARAFSVAPSLTVPRNVMGWQSNGIYHPLIARPTLFSARVRFFSTLPNHTPLSMPALSPTMTQGNIAKWMVKVGQKVNAGDQLCDLETDKATIAWEAQDEGYVGAILAPEGASDIPVGQVVLVICENEADVPAFANYKPSGGAAPAAKAAAPQPQAAAAPAAKPAAPAAAPASSPSPQVNAPSSGGSLLEQVRQKQWAFSKQFGLPTPQNNYS